MRKKSTGKKPPRSDTSTKAKKTTKRKKAVAKLQTPKTRNAGTFTEAMYFQKIRSSLRTGFRFWLPMMQALKAASRPSQSSNKRLKTEYQCAHCKAWFQRTMVQIDHIVPCGELNSFEDIVPFIKRLTAEDASSYQVLCKHHCHKVKTLQEKEERKTRKKAA
jgi:hypothetical protein